MFLQCNIDRNDQEQKLRVETIPTELPTTNLKITHTKKGNATIFIVTFPFFEKTEPNFPVISSCTLYRVLLSKNNSNLSLITINLQIIFLLNF